MFKSILVGSLLGDGWLEKQKVNARFRFEQSHIRTEFFFSLYEYFILFCKSSPRLRERLDKRTNKIYKTWHFSTRSLPLFTEYYNLFYSSNRKKVIPTNIIQFLDPIVLAYWIMCDGYKKNNGVGLATNCFSISDNQLLINALNIKFRLNSRLVNDHDLPTIFISKSDLNILQNIVSPYMHSTLFYKIHF